MLLTLEVQYKTLTPYPNPNPKTTTTATGKQGSGSYYYFVCVYLFIYLFLVYVKNPFNFPISRLQSEWTGSPLSGHVIGGQLRDPGRWLREDL